MIFPVGDGTKETFEKYWYIASRFGENRGSYYHSGDDYNLKTGGETDFGKPVLAVADGEITGIDNSSTTGFGKQIYLRFVINGKTYWAGYDHLNMINVYVGQMVKKGYIIGHIGKSGTKSSHLHFVIKNKANGMDNVPNTLEELKEWEDPTEFIYKHYQEADMADDYEDAVHKSNQYDLVVKHLLGDKAVPRDHDAPEIIKIYDDQARRIKELENNSVNKPDDSPELEFNGRNIEYEFKGKRYIDNYKIKGK